MSSGRRSNARARATPGAASAGRAAKSERHDAGAQGERAPVGERAVDILKTAAAVVGALAALIAGIVAIAKHFEHHPQPIAAVHDAKITDVNASPMRFRAYVRILGQPTSTFTAELLRRPGLLVDYRVRLDGYVGVLLPVKWTLLDAHGQPLQDRHGNTSLEATARRDIARKRLWVPTSGLQARRARVLVEVFDDPAATNRVDASVSPITPLAPPADGT